MIDVLDRITYYRELKNWSEYQLAKHSVLTQSTISAWYRKNMYPTIPSLEKICNAFGITLSQFFATESDTFNLTSIQKDLMVKISHFSEKQRKPY